MQRAPPPACLTTLVSASWMIRYADRSTPAGTALTCPEHSRLTCTPAPLVRSMSLPRRASPGAGASGADMPVAARAAAGEPGAPGAAAAAAAAVPEGGGGAVG